MIILKNTTETLELTTSAAAAIDVSISFADHTSTTFTPSTQETAVTSATTTVILAAPAASTQRQVKFISLENKGTSSNTVILKKDISAVEYTIYSATLQAGENLTYVDGIGFAKHSAGGDTTDMNTTDKRGPISATSFNFLKVGAANEAAGVLHSQHAATGNPGAWSPGTPGLNGRATDGTTTADAGCIPVKYPVSGVNYLTNFAASSTVASMQFLADFLWVNTGLVVTTTTAQAITPVALPARDEQGTTNGEGVMAGILVTTATTNAAAVTNTTISYTNQAGTAAKTATISSFPATAVAGTLVPFQLAAGDQGVRSVQSVTLGTSYAAGAISLVLYRIVAGVPVLLANAGGNLNTNQPLNIRLYNGACLIPVTMPTGTGAQTITGTVNIEEK